LAREVFGFFGLSTPPDHRAFLRVFFNVENESPLDAFTNRDPAGWDRLCRQAWKRLWELLLDSERPYRTPSMGINVGCMEWVVPFEWSENKENVT
jgi:hypothetical protein